MDGVPKVPKSIIRRLERLGAKLAADRDALRDFKDEIEGLTEAADSALADINAAIDRLSELV
jgi:ABC-type transporter Mla subunit MlaD